MYDGVGLVPFGGREVRRLGYGCAHLADVGAGEAIALCRDAVDRGVQLLDLAALYGAGRCEEIVAEALHPYPADVLLMSKAGIVLKEDGSGIRRDGRPETIRAECTRSLSRLRVDTIDLYQCHVVDPQVPFEETVGAFAELRREGKIRDVGLCNVSVAQLETAESIVDIVSVQNRFNAGDRAAGDVLDACEARGIPFVAYHPLQVQGTPAEQVVARVAAEHGVSPQRVALRWLLDRSPLVAPIPGTTKREHLHDDLGAASLELTAADRAALDAGAVQAGVADS